MGQNKLEKVRALLKARQIGLNPPATLETVRRIEARYQIVLPQEYVWFITEIGNGGLLPDCSGLRQCACLLYPIEQCSFEKAAGVFPYQDPRDWARERMRDQPDGPEGGTAAAENGHFAFTAPVEGEGYTWELIVNGPCRGEVWAFTDWKLCRGKAVDFLDWVVDRVEGGAGQARYDDPEDEPLADLDARLVRIRNKLKRKKAALHPILPAERLSELEHRYGFRLPEGYRRFLTEIGNGFEPSNRTFDKFLYPLEYGGLEKLGLPFPLTDGWTFAAEQAPPSGEALLCVAADAAQTWEETRQGCILLSRERKRNTPIEQAYLLIVTGARAGEIWRFAYNAAKGQGCYAPMDGLSFMDWLEGLLNGFQF